MKVTDLRRGLLATLAAGGMIAPSATYAANLNTDLVVNGGFENVDLATTSTVNAPKILDWLGVSSFAYSHDGSSSSSGVVPNYAEGTPPPDSGHWYFTSNISAPDTNAPNQFYQDIAVGSGATGNAIASGFAGYDLSAFMSSYLNDADIGRANVEFRNGSGAVLGSALMSDSDPGSANVWNQNTKTGVIPIGTATVRLSIYGTPVGNGGPDGYIDNVTFKVSVVPLPSLRITVNRNTSSVTLSNDTGAPVTLSGYSITSAFEGLSPSSWLSIADNYDSGNPGPNQVDATHAWSKLTNPATHGDLSEADLQAGTGASLANTRTVNLGSDAWLRSPNEDLIFQYISGGQVKDGIVSYIGNNDSPFASGDLNFSGTLNAADWVVLRTNQHTSLAGLSKAQAYALGDLNGDLRNDFADFALFKQAYDVANGSGAFATMVASIPEPTTSLLVMIGGTLLLSTSRRNRNSD
jgi:hypothetical protein